MNIESPTKTDALNSLDKISSILKHTDSDFEYVDHITLIKNYIKDIAKQRQDKRDLELKEIYSEIVKEYLLERSKLIKNLKSFIKRNSLSCKEFLIGDNWTSSNSLICYENDNPGYYDDRWVKKEFVIEMSCSKSYLKLIIPSEGNPLDLKDPYNATILRVEVSDKKGDYIAYSKDYKWCFAWMESPWLVCHYILSEMYKLESHRKPSKKFERLMFKILKSYPKTRYHK